MLSLERCRCSSDLFLSSITRVPDLQPRMYITGKDCGLITLCGKKTHTPDGNGDGDRSEDSSGNGNGDEDNGTGTRVRSWRAEERRRSARNRKIVIDGRWETGETWLGGKRKKCRK